MVNNENYNEYLSIKCPEKFGEILKDAILETPIGTPIYSSASDSK